MAGTKPTTIKEALVRFEEKGGKKASECETVRLIGVVPFIEKMDASISTLTCCRQLSLSTNAIEKIQNLNGLKQLKILSLGRNSIKSLAGLEAVGETLEQLWISYNLIEKLRGVNVLKKLQVLYMSHNLVKEESEFQKLADLPCLREILFIGNPVVEKFKDENDWRDFAGSKVKTLTKLDGVPLIRQEESNLED